MSLAAPELVEAARLRWRHGLPRLLMAITAAAAAAPHIGGFGVLFWLIPWVVCQLTEITAFRPALAGRPLSAERGRLGLLFSALSAITYGAISVPLWRIGGDQGGVIAVLILAGATVHHVIVCQASRRMFMAVMAPTLFYVALSPMLALLGGESVWTAAAMTAAAAIFGSNAVSLTRVLATKTREESRARKALQGSLAAAEEATAAKSQFVAMVGHELRTPISAVLAASAELERHADPQVRDHARLIAEGGRLMRTVLNDLLDLAKIEAGRMAVEHTAYDLREVVEQTARFWSAEAAAKGLQLGVRGAEDLPRGVEGDPTRLRQILNNQRSNAVKFTERGAVSILCQVGDDSAGRRVMRIAVSDSGPGLAPERLSQLFTPFTQADASVTRLHGGTGLGLAISRQLARLMDGELDADSRLGAGSTFTLKLPLKTTVERVAPPTAVRLPTETAESGLKLLIADDHQINRRAMRLLLTPLQPQVTEACNGAEALTALANERFDVVLMDVNMPDMSGHEVVRRLRAQPGPNQETTVLAVTASTEPSDVRECLMAGMNGFVAKPIEAAELLEAVSVAAPPRGTEDETAAVAAADRAAA